MNPDSFVKELRRVIADVSLIGERQRGRAVYSPGLSFGRHFGPPLPGARQAAVLAMIEVDEDACWQEWSIPLTVRPDDLQSHPGQISLPGGSLEANEQPQQAAEREFIEELGFPAFPGEVLGSLLPLYIYNSNFRVLPFVGWCAPLDELAPCKREVARMLHLPLGSLCQLDSHRRGKFSRGGATWTAPTIRVGEDQVWGATAIILGELATLIRMIVAV